MDEFGVLVESIGFKAQGRSAPLAKLKSQPKQHQQSNTQTSFPSNISPPAVQSNPPTNDQFFVDDLDGIFRSRNSHDIFSGDDVFGGPFSNSNKSGTSGIDLDAVFSGNSSSKASTTLFDDFLGTIPKDEDLFGFNSNQSKPNLEKKGSGFDDLIPGFGPTTTSTNHGSTPSSPSVDNFFEDFVSGGKITSEIDELEDFARAKPQNNANQKPDIKISKEAMNKVQEKMKNSKDFGTKQSANIKVSLPEKDLRKSKVTPMAKVEKTSPPISNNTKKKQSSPNYFDDFSFFGEPASSAVEFVEIEGEPEERRKARLKKDIKTKERMAQALNEKNQRDLQAQREQDEKQMLSETLDDDIKRWAAGKEGNLRALLSSLQYVLWPECEWKPVSLTDLITSISVKKVYLKATLYVHPDKVQQKGAKQKYIAERVFDVLKEAWNKFSAEELR